VDVIGIDVSRDPFDRGAQLDTFPARTESSQLRHSDQLPPTARHLQQPRGHQETRSGHRQEPNKDRPRQGLAKPVIIIVRATKPVSSVSFLVDLGRKISERTGEPLEVVFIPADQCLDSGV